MSSRPTLLMVSNFSIGLAGSCSLKVGITIIVEIVAII